MQHYRLFSISLGALALASACGGSIHNKSALDAYRTNKAKVAVVSLTVNDYADILKSGNMSSSDVDNLIDKKLGEMLTLTEQKLSNHFSVMPAADFGAQDSFQQLSSGTPFEVFRPEFEGKPMPIFASSRGELIKSQMTPDRAKKLAEALGVDMVAVVYSEWQTKTGGIVPTTKAVAKTVMSIYDKTGEQLYGMRRNQVGGRNVGAFNATAINEDTISAWVDAYDKSLQLLVDGL